MSIFRGFEGFRDPTEQEAREALESGPVVLDTNVLLDIYSFEEPARELALDVLEGLGARLWIPHQVMREFWRNRATVVASTKRQEQTLASVKTDLLGILNSLRPDRAHSDRIRELRTLVETQLDDLSRAIDEARGAPLDVKRILQDSTLDPVLQRLERILEGRVGEPLKDEEELVAEGLRRFELNIPPGYEDGADKADEVPERGTGDFLLWEQTLRHLEGLKLRKPFVLVTNDSKEDWRVVLKRPSKQVLGVRPELVSEAIERTGVAVILLLQQDLYRLRSTSENQAASVALLEATAKTVRSVTTPRDLWTVEAYRQLLDTLNDQGRDVQAAAITLAAQNGGVVTRAEIFEWAGYSEDRTLVRFAMPAQRAAQALVDDGVLSEAAVEPLRPVYEGQGKATGYRVPPEFVRFENGDAPPSHTWIEAAIEVAKEDPDRYWTVDELVSAIELLGLRDLSNAKTPHKTLSRDLRVRARRWFEASLDGRYRLRRDET